MAQDAHRSIQWESGVQSFDPWQRDVEVASRTSRMDRDRQIKHPVMTAREQRHQAMNARKAAIEAAVQQTAIGAEVGAQSRIAATAAHEVGPRERQPVSPIREPLRMRFVSKQQPKAAAVSAVQDDEMAEASTSAAAVQPKRPRAATTATAQVDKAKEISSSAATGSAGMPERQMAAAAQVGTSQGVYDTAAGGGSVPSLTDVSHDVSSVRAGSGVTPPVQAAQVREPPFAPRKSEGCVAKMFLLQGKAAVIDRVEQSVQHPENVVTSRASSVEGSVSGRQQSEEMCVPWCIECARRERSDPPCPSRPST